MSKSLFLQTLTIAGVFAASAAAQGIAIQSAETMPDVHGAKVYDNTRQLQLDLKLDREVYLRGEAIHATAALWNPTGQYLEVFDPRKDTLLDTRHWGERNGFAPDWLEMLPEPPTLRDPDWFGPTIVVAPGQRIERHLTEIRPAAWEEDLHQSDRFMLCFGYVGMLGLCSQAPYTIVQPTIVASTSVKLTSADTPRFVHGMVLESNGKRYIVVARRAVYRSDLAIPADRQLDWDSLGSIAPYERAAEVSMAVQSIRLEADRDDNITVEWQDDSGSPHAVSLDKDRTGVRTIR